MNKHYLGAKNQSKFYGWFSMTILPLVKFLFRFFKIFSSSREFMFDNFSILVNCQVLAYCCMNCDSIDLNFLNFSIHYLTKFWSVGFLRSFCPIIELVQKISNCEWTNFFVDFWMSSYPILVMVDIP